MLTEIRHLCKKNARQKKKRGMEMRLSRLFGLALSSLALTACGIGDNVDDFVPGKFDEASFDNFDWSWGEIKR